MNQNSSEQMKYIEITEAGGPEVLKVVQGKKPEIKEDEVLLKSMPQGSIALIFCNDKGLSDAERRNADSRIGSCWDHFTNWFKSRKI
jgi:hypothetical protein